MTSNFFKTKFITDQIFDQVFCFPDLQRLRSNNVGKAHKECKSVPQFILRVLLIKNYFTHLQMLGEYFKFTPYKGMELR